MISLRSLRPRQLSGQRPLRLKLKLNFQREYKLFDTDLCKCLHQKNVKPILSIDIYEYKCF